MDTTVKLDSGKISGVEVSGVASFKGIPYVAPPTGDLRWRPPHTIAPWAGTRPAKDFGPACPQPPILEKRYGIKFDSTSEDCLTLNVWTAANNSTERHPVLFWIHFGGNVAGSGSMVDGSALAKQGAVVVTINYRLGAFGFLALPALSKESTRASSGNYGLLDQIQALLWVHRNIDKFGGDPSNVTIFGVSAGANDVAFLMTSPIAQGLFHRAIMESGSLFPPEQVRLADAERSGMKLFAGDAASLRLRSTKEIMTAAGSHQAIVDGWVIPRSPSQIFESGNEANVPLIAGSNADEGSVFTADLPFKTVAHYRAYLANQYPNAVELLFSLYPAADEAQFHSAATRIMTDYLAGSARYLARLHSAVNAKSFVYHFTHSSGPLGAFHTSEVPFAFGTAPGDLSKAMSAAWLRFATTGDPGWPAYAVSADQYMEFGDTIKVGSGLHKKEIDALTASFESRKP